MKKKLLSNKESHLEKNPDAEENRPARAVSKKVFWLRLVGIVLGSLVAVVLLAVMGYHIILDYYLGKINIVTEEDLVYETERVEEENSFLQDTEALEQSGILTEGDLPLISDTKEVTNILLIGVDGAEDNRALRTDVMMLLSINEKTKKITLCSFMRDLYARYPTEPANPINGDLDKLNHAHMYGGPELTLAVLKETFNIDIQRYVKINFTSFVHLVDAMGGIDVELTAKEINYINHAQKGTAELSHLNSYPTKSLPQRDGLTHLNGIQALTHARNRKTDSDFGRTNRQREIIMAMIEKMKGLSLGELNASLNVFLPFVTTNIQAWEMKGMILQLPACAFYDIVSTHIPQEGSYYGVDYNLVPDVPYNSFYLYETIYGKRADGDPRTLSE